MRAAVVLLGVVISTSAIGEPGQLPVVPVPSFSQSPMHWSAEEVQRQERLKEQKAERRRASETAIEKANAAAKARHAARLAATLASNKCPQERAIYSLAGATLTLEPDPHSIMLGWGAVLRSPSAPVRLYSTVSNGVSTAYLIAQNAPDWLSSEIELLDASGAQVWGEAGNPAAPMLRLPNFGPRGTWRLTGCSKP